MQIKRSGAEKRRKSPSEGEKPDRVRKGEICEEEGEMKALIFYFLFYRKIGLPKKSGESGLLEVGHVLCLVKLSKKFSKIGFNYTMNYQIFILALEV